MNNKCASIYRVMFFFGNNQLNTVGSDRVVIDYSTMSVDELIPSTCDFSEKRSDQGAMIDVEIKIKLTDQSIDVTRFVNRYCAVAILYTNGDSKLVGADIPLQFVNEISGNPTANYLHYKGQQPEFSKFC